MNRLNSDKETGRQGDKEKRRVAAMSPCLRVSLSPCLLLTVCALIGARTAPLLAAEEPVPAIAWYSDVGQAFADAHEKKQQPAFVFGAAGAELVAANCSTAFLHRRLPRKLKTFIPVRVDIQKSRPAARPARHARRSGIFRVFDADGKQVAHASGSIEAGALKTFLIDAKKAQPESGAPSLSMLLSEQRSRRALLKVESSGKLPEGQNLSR